MDFQKSILDTVDRIFRRPKQHAGEKALNMPEEVDAAGPPPEQESIHEPMVVSPTHAKEIMLDVPDPSAEEVVSIVNDLALNDISNSSPKPTVPGKRKRQDADVVDGSSKKRVAKGTGIKDTRDDSVATTTNGVTMHQGRSSGASSKVVKAALGKLRRPNKEQAKQHMAKIHPAVQSSDDMWDPPPTPKKQAEKAALPPITPTRKPPNLETTPRTRERPRRVGPSPTEKTTLAYKGQRRNTQKMKAKPGQKGRLEGEVSPEIEAGEVCEVVIENLPEKGGPKARQNGSKTQTKSGDDQKKRTPERRSTRSVAAANGQKDVILNANTDLTKKPERDARKAAKQRRNLELASEALAGKRERTVARKAQISKNLVRASPPVLNDVVSKSMKKKRRIGVEEHEEEEKEESEREERIDSVEAVDRDGQTSSYLDAGEEGSTEVEEEESVIEESSEVVENDEEAEGQEELELFGANSAWKTIIEGAQSVCGSRLPLNHMPMLLTKTIKDLVYDVKEAREVYEQLLPLKGTEQDSVVGLNNDLKKSLDAIDRQITSFSEEKAATKGSEMIRDIYARAIPAMVFLLQSALETRIYHSDEPCDLKTLSSVVTGLEEVIRLQEIAIRLCDKARNWKAKPVPTSRPIIRPTTHKMYPNLKNMHGTFSKSLQEQKRKRKVKENAFKTAQKQKDLHRPSQQASQEAARKNELRDRRIRASIEEEAEKRQNAKRSYKQLVQNEPQARPQSLQVDGQIESRAQWSEDEEIELYIQLKKGYDPSLTSTY